MTNPSATAVIATALCMASCGALSHSGGKDEGAFHATDVSDALADDGAAAEPVCGSALAWPTEPSLGLAIDSTVVLMEATGRADSGWNTPRWSGCVHVCVKQPSPDPVEIHWAGPDPAHASLWVTRPDAAATVEECSKACSVFCVNAAWNWDYHADTEPHFLILKMSRGGDDDFELTRLDLPIVLNE